NGIAKVTINRPEKRNAFTPLTVNEMIDAFADARDDSSIGVIILTGMGEKAFCSGGDHSPRAWWICRVGSSSSFKCPRFTSFDSCDSKACHCDGRWICDWRWTCFTCRL